MKEQREWENSEPNERKGMVHFRNCNTGCPIMESAMAFEKPEMLIAGCADCQLRPGPVREAEAVMLRWNLPDSVLDMERRPYWFVAGVALARAMYAPRGF